MKIFLIIPAFNEATVIRQVLESLLPLGHQIILVDDGSTDETAVIARSLPVRVIQHVTNLGQGAALETGMEAARRLSADYVVHFDADGQHDEEDIEKLLKPLLEGNCDIVFGSRFMSPSAPGLSTLRRITLQTGRLINYWLTGVLLTDAHNGFRAMNRHALNKIHFTQSSMAHATEILYCVKKHSLRQLELPVHIRYTAYSKKKGQGILGSVNILFHLFFKRN